MTARPFRDQEKRRPLKNARGHRPRLQYALATQKLNFSASCMNRGFTDVVEMTPNVLELRVVSGPLNWGVLNKLKNSARNSRTLLSEDSATFFAMERSMFCWAGPRTMPTPVLPKAVALPSAPTTGGVVRHCLSK